MIEPTEPPDRPTTDLTRHTLSGLQWTYLATAVGVFLQFGMTAVMARLLTPTAFGLVALAGIFLRFVHYFAKGGITQALIQKPDLETNHVRAAFTLSAGLALLFSAAMILFAPAAGRIAQDPELVPVLRWLTLGLVLQGLGAPAFALLRRDLRFRALAVTDLASYIVGYVVVGLSLAVAGAGVYALVGAMLTQSGVYALGVYVLVRHPLLPTASRTAYRTILGFGARVSLIGFLEYLQSNLDTLAVGRWAGASQLGLYNRGKMLADLPAYQLTSGLSQVLFPSFSAIQLDRDRLLRAYLTAIGSAAALVLPLNAGMAVAAPEIVLTLLGPQWVGAIDVVPWLLLASSITLLGHFAGMVAEAQAALNAKILIAGLTTATLVALLLLAGGGPLWRYGAAVALAAGVSHGGHVLVLTRTLDTRVTTLLHPYLRCIAGAGLVAAAIGLVRAATLSVGAPVPVVLAAEVVSGATTLAVLLRLGPLRVFRDDLARRLHDAGMVGRGGGRLGRLVSLVVGPPPTE
jgi:lipopolysaccharide exporter